MTRLLPPKLVALLAGVMICSTLLAPWPDLKWPDRVLGLVILGAGAFLCVRHARLFDKLGTNIQTFDDPDILVCSGAFRWTRNPMYLGFTAMLFGFALALGSAAALAGPFAFFVVADRWYIPFEERRMEAVFGADYDRYCQDVRRWAGPTQTRKPGQTRDAREVRNHT